MGQGYRIVAASGGLQRTEAGEITARAPSGDGLCGASTDAVGAASFPLTSGRFAVLRSVYAGKEPTGRGGQRTYTRVFILDADGYRRFHNNPFEVLRAAEAAGLLGIDLAPERTLPSLSLAAAHGNPAEALLRSVLPLDGGWLGHFVERLLADDTVVVSATGDLPALAETVLLSLPAPLRATLSLAVGMRFSVGRISRLTVISGDAARAQQLVRGRAIGFADLTRPAKAPSSAHPWSHVVQSYLAAGRGAELVAMTSGRFTAADVEVIDRVGSACIDLDNLPAAAPAELIDTAAVYTDSPVPGPLGADLSRRIIHTARERLRTMIVRGDQGRLEVLWKDVVASWRQAQAAGADAGSGLIRILREICDAALDRMGQISPLDVGPFLFDMADCDRFGRPAHDFERLRTAVLMRIAEWVTTAAAPSLERARGILAAWARRFRGDVLVPELLARVEKRLAEELAAANP